jgi:hypothetical protein
MSEAARGILQTNAEAARETASVGGLPEQSHRDAKKTVNGSMWLAECAPDLMQRLSCLPTRPYVGLLHRRKPLPFSVGHNTTFEEKIYTRWCCIDLLIHSFNRELRRNCGVINF